MVREYHMVRPVLISPGVTPARRNKLGRYVLENKLRFGEVTDVGVQNRIQHRLPHLLFGLRPSLCCT